MPTYEEMKALREKREAARMESEKRRDAMRRMELDAKGVQPFDMSTIPPQRCDHPNTMEDSTATVLWAVVMFISLFFNGGWVLCILETAVWLKFITRYRK